jgi:DegT/DnrJ/EryC1/StrS aminotransferase family
MSWRWLAPVYSPVSPRALVHGIGAACGVLRTRNEIVIEELKSRYDAMEVLLTDSGTSALILALRATVPPGGTVAYPGYACIDLTSAAVGANVRVRLYDLDPTTLSPDLESVRRVIERGVDAIVVAHLHGYPADIVGVRALAAARGIPVIEDAAQGAGGTLNGAKLGSIGDISILSFGRGKGMTAGSGGALLVRTPRLAQWIHRVRAELRPAERGGREIVALAAQWLFVRALLYRLPAAIPTLKLGEMVYKLPQPPRTMRLAAAAVLPTALRMDPEEVHARSVRARNLLSRINGVSRFRPIRAIADGEPGFLRLALVDAGGHTLPPTMLGAIRGYPLTLEQHQQLRSLLIPGERAGDGSVFLRDHLFTVPTHSRVAGSDVLRLTNWIATSPRVSPGDAHDAVSRNEWRHA